MWYKKSLSICYITGQDLLLHKYVDFPCLNFIYCFTTKRPEDGSLLPPSFPPPTSICAQRPKDRLPKPQKTGPDGTPPLPPSRNRMSVNFFERGELRPAFKRYDFYYFTFIEVKKKSHTSCYYFFFLVP